MLVAKDEQNMVQLTLCNHDPSGCKKETMSGEGLPAPGLITTVMATLHFTILIPFSPPIP